MKYIHYFKENVDTDFSDVEKIFENSRWLVIRPKSYDSLLSWSQDTGWNIENVNAKYWSGYGSTEKYRFNDKIYICANKQNDKKYLFDLDVEKFYDNNGDDIYISELFDNNTELITVFGDIIYCSDIVKENDEYWIVVEDYSDFEPYFKLDSRIRKDYIKDVLSGDIISDYDYDDFDIDVDVNLDKDNIGLLKMILRLEQLFDNDGDYDYNVDEIEYYDDITTIIDEYRLGELKKTLKKCICEINEISNSSLAYDDTVDRIYKFFNLVDGSAKWEKYNNKDVLYIKFSTKLDAYKAKLIMTNYGDSYSDEKIDGDPPYNGYYPDAKSFNESFNNTLPDKVADYNSGNVDSDIIFEYYDLWIETTKENPTMSIDDIMQEINLKIDAKKYNL